MNLGFFTMPIHPPEKDWRLSLREDREAFLLADELGFTESPDDPLTILMGCGDDGQPGYYHAFVFDDAGKLTDHYIAE